MSFKRMRNVTQHRRGALAFKLLVWVMLGYTVIGALHGLAPQLWYHHYSEKNDNGPFRVLIFTSFTALAMAVFLLCKEVMRAIESIPAECPRSRTVWSRWLLRSPPFLA